MADLSKSLTPSELSDLKAKAMIADKYSPTVAEKWDFRSAANSETIIRLIDMIERRDEQIEKLRETVKHFAKVGFDKAREAVAATEPVNDKR